MTDPATDPASASPLTSTNAATADETAGQRGHHARPRFDLGGILPVGAGPALVPVHPGEVYLTRDQLAAGLRRVATTGRRGAAALEVLRTAAAGAR